MTLKTTEDRIRENIEMSKKLSKIKGIEDKINTTIGMPIYIRRVYCLLKRIYSYRFYKEYVEYNRQIRKLYNKHKGERCFVIGMGPSLNKTNFSLIKDEILFGVNALYNGLKDFGINPQYWCVTDIVEFNKHYKALLNLDTTLFLTEDAGQLFLEKKKHFMKNAKKEPIVIRPYGYVGTWNKISKDLTKGGILMPKSMTEFKELMVEG